ncbi:6-pyruvoyl tetrahydrobiopterin synthase [Rhizobium sp. Root149]|jgi:6-pyruvoyltetrahydropterin/6-carboxytetrahydropterin synthase|uniref:6-carboxy-5,6,7,8-tetrahydropterin synthase n=1 Tax=Rhizobium rhizoryzae TaxID=451876 RepID=A0A7W6LIX7_9HYPH|nr:MULTISPECIES: 6-carboxytetrahydropterin synthase QueD [Rhizobium]KQZ49830.1 6-pyruvoyl tetrahydrobiopterin synthase [Rhizobium sp. Root149]MBB4143921.1 6-pyruvoyltetrahydropterin/6-carboxytetrahydropterin synthase [Rhizobium rhizoryzae]
MFRITKEFHFSASHRLDHLPEDHQCNRLHGHNYIVVVELAGESLNADGFVRDYHDLKALKTYIDDQFDHRHLNDVLGHGYTTAENLARHFYEWCKARFPETSAVKVSETPKTWAEYRP